MEKIAILAAYNLENSIEDVVKRTKKFVDEVIVISDGSLDNTHQNALKAGALCPKHSYIRGKGFAVRKGIKFSKKFNPEIIILMDSDGQHLPEEIPLMVAPIQNGLADMVVGSRMKGVLRTSPINKLGNFILKFISYLLTRKWFTDTETGFRAFIAKKLYLLELNSMFYEIESELLLKALHKGLIVTEVPITVPFSVPGVTIMDGIKTGIYKIRLGLKLKISR